MTVTAMLATATVVSPIGSAALADDDLSCSTHGDTQTCQALSDLVIRTMETTAPGSATTFAAQLARGYAFTETRTITCVLGATCDAWPIASAAAATIDASSNTSCTIVDPDVCRAVELALANKSAAAATIALAGVLEKIAPSLSPHRGAELGLALSDLVLHLDGVPDGRDIADTVVGVVTLAAYLIPATSADSAIPPGSVPTGVEIDLPTDDGAGCGIEFDVEVVTQSNSASAASVGCLAAKRARKVDCSVTYDTYNALYTRESADWQRFALEANAGIANRQWVNPAADHRGCPAPTVRFTGTIFVEATSNAGSFIVSKTIRSNSVTTTEDLKLRGPWAATRIWWELDKVDIDYDFPYGVVLHYFSPPAGDYLASASGHAELLNGYRTSDTNKPYRNHAFSCTKFGSGASRCEVNRID